MEQLDLLKLAQSGTNVTISVDIKDLIKMVEFTVEKTKEYMQTQIELQQKLSSVEKEYYSIEETSALFEVNRSTLWRWNKIGLLRNIEIGGFRRYRKSDIDNLLQSRNSFK